MSFLAGPEPAPSTPNDNNVTPNATRAAIIIKAPKRPQACKEKTNAFFRISWSSCRPDCDGGSERFVCRSRGQRHYPDFGVKGRLVHRRLRGKRHTDVSRAAIPAVNRRVGRGPRVRRVANIFVGPGEPH